ncbi:MAG: hypothetical protein IT548_12030 [Alphaproteobacteria bacterium]|nr:hypothetical protein [Alphaproteobacteria bacterium]
MRRITTLLATAALAAGLAEAGRPADAVQLHAPYAYGLLGSATCAKGDEQRLKALLGSFAAVAGATGDPTRQDAKAYCGAFTKAFPVSAAWGDVILKHADAAGDGAPQPMKGDGPGTRVEEIEISFLGLKVKVKFGPKQPTDSEGHTGGGGDDRGGEGEDGGTTEDGGEPSEPAEPPK